MHWQVGVDSCCCPFKHVFLFGVSSIFPSHPLGGWLSSSRAALLQLTVTLKQGAVLMVEATLIWNWLEQFSVGFLFRPFLFCPVPLCAVDGFSLLGDMRHPCDCLHFFRSATSKNNVSLRVVTRTPTIFVTAGTLDICDRKRKRRFRQGYPSSL